MPGRIRRRADAPSVADLVPDPHVEPRVEIVEREAMRWINIERPGQAEEAWLRERFEFHDLDYEDVRSRNQRPKIDEYDDYLFLILHLPVFDKRVGRLNAAELDIFIGPDFLITVPNEPLKPIEYLFERCKSHEETRESRMSQGTGFLLYTIVDDAFTSFFPMLRKIGLKLDSVEEDIFVEGRSREVVRDISNVKQEIINFRKIIRPQRAVLRDLERVKSRFLADDLEIYFDDIVDASERMWDMLENFKEVVEALEATNESVISHSVNDVLRVLTVFSVFFLPLTLIASVFGMNNHVPGQGSVEGFWIVVGGMALTLCGMLAYFRRRGWL
ncbi:MAG: magnesium transporter CorA family protein [Solirubrobacterales bacterium]